MSLLDFILELQKQKLQAEERFGDIGSIERSFFDKSYDWLLDNLDYKSGRFVVDETLFKQMNDFADAVQKIINTSKAYEGRVARYLSDVKDIERNMATYHATENNIDFKKIGLDPIRQVFTDSIGDAFLGNGINKNFVTPLKDLVYRNTLLGMNQMQAREVLNNYIVSGKDESGKLSRYLIQTAQQGVDSYAGMINKKLAETYNFDGYIISGSLIETSSPQCVEAVDQSMKARGFIKNSDWNAIFEIAKDNGLIEGTTLKNLDFNKLHWGCRHDFTPAFTPKKLEEEPPIERIMRQATQAGPEVDKLARKLAKKYGGVATPVNFKSRESIERKARNEYNGDISKVKDAVRSTIIVAPDQIPALVAEFKAMPGTLRVKEQLAGSDPMGYSGTIINFKGANGLSAEIQVNSSGMIYGKEIPDVAKGVLGAARWQEIRDQTKLEGGLGHKFYEERRVLDRDDKADQARARILEAKSKEYYDKLRF